MGDKGEKSVTTAEQMLERMKAAGIEPGNKLKAGETAFANLSEEDKECLMRADAKFRNTVAGMQQTVKSLLNEHCNTPDIGQIDLGKSPVKFLEEISAQQRKQIGQNWWTGLVAWVALAVAVVSFVVSVFK